MQAKRVRFEGGKRVYIHPVKRPANPVAFEDLERGLASFSEFNRQTRKFPTIHVETAARPAARFSPVSRMARAESARRFALLRLAVPSFTVASVVQALEFHRDTVRGWENPDRKGPAMLESQWAVLFDFVCKKHLNGIPFEDAEVLVFGQPLI